MVYGRQPYGTLPRIEQNYDIQVGMTEQLQGSLRSLGLRNNIAAGLSESVSGAGRLGKTINVVSALSDVLSGAAQLRRNWPIDEGLAETASGIGHASKSIYADAALSEALDGSVKLGLDWLIAADLSEILSGATLAHEYLRMGYGRQAYGRMLETQKPNTAHLSLNIPVNSELEENVFGSAALGKNVYLNKQLEENLTGSAYVSTGKSIEVALAETFGGRAFLNTSYSITASLAESLNAVPVVLVLPKFLRMGYGHQTYGRIIETAPINAAHLSKNIYLTKDLNERLLGKASAFSGVLVKEDIAEKLTGSAQLRRNRHIASHLRETFGGDGHLSKNIYLSKILREALLGSGHLSKNIHIVLPLVESLAGLSHLSRNIYMTQGLYEILLGYADARRLQEYVTTVLGSIPAGAMLVIDAENFNMTLQQGSTITDVIHLHKGDWLWISRNTVNFTAAGIGSTYTMEVLYNALFL
jgi:hypothetical protein